MIDAHQHFWQLARGDYAWLTPELEVLYRDFGPDDLAPLYAEAGISRSVLVQAAPTLAETRHLLDLAARTSFVGGVVGWIDMTAADASAQLETLARDSALLGIRPMIQDEPDPDWMLAESWKPVLESLVRLDLSFDALVRPVHLPRLRRLLAHHPELRVVVDHGAKPDIASGAFAPWAEEMAALAAETSASCKLSGLVTEAGGDWSEARLRPYVEHLLEHFGPHRLMWGSDWPVVELAGGFEDWRRMSLGWLARLSEGDREAILGDNAARFYRLDET